MITMDNMRVVLHTILFGKPPLNEPDLTDWKKLEKYIIPLQGNWNAPTRDVDDSKGDYVGYIITTVMPNIMAVDSGPTLFKSVRVITRLSFLGPNAYDNACNTLMWDDRQDVKSILEQYQAQLAYMQRVVRPYSINQDGMNTEIAWITELTVLSFIEVSTNRSPWVIITK
jgi:hypothetical protein